MEENIIENKAEDSEGKNYSARQLIVFRQGTEDYGLDISQIKEVVLTPSITKMPQTPSHIKGVANIRGNIIAIVDLEEKFGLKSEDDLNYGKYTLVIENENVKAGLLVQKVPNTLSIYENEIDESPNIISDSSMDSNYIQGIVKKDNRLIILIDIYRVITETDVMHLS